MQFGLDALPSRRFFVSRQLADSEVQDGCFPDGIVIQVSCVLATACVMSRKSIDIRLRDIIRFSAYCMLLIVPLYAIIRSALAGNWLMVVIDTLLVPIGFMHGVLLLFGFVD